MPSQKLIRALGYPYSSPRGDYLFRNGNVENLDKEFNLEGRTPVLAVGSSRAPEQLHRKFGNNQTIPVTELALNDYDVVYSAHITSYGSVPATLCFSQGATVKLALNWLKPNQLEIMHRTEAVGFNYDYCKLNKLSAQPEIPYENLSVGCYIARRGAICINGKPVALSAVAASNRGFSEMNQTDVIKHVKTLYGNGDELETWLAQMISNPQLREEVTKKMGKDAMPIVLPNAKNMDTSLASKRVV